MEVDFDLVVVGCGLVGAAAGKHALQENPRLRVAIVGPESEEVADVYGCHSDEGRIARTLDTDTVWSELASRSMKRYSSIEEASGIKFHSAVGCLAVGRASGEFLSSLRSAAEACGTDLEEVDSEEMAKRWPHLRLNASLFEDFDDDEFGEIVPEYAGLFESGMAGHISPRKLLAAQLKIFRNLGGVVIDDVVESIDGHVLRGSKRTVTSDKILVATNAWTNFNELLPRKVKLTLTTQTAVRRKVDAHDSSSSSIAASPSVIVRGGAQPLASRRKKFDACYVLPPVEYDDGVYVKIGHGSYFERPLSSEKEAVSWYRDHGAETRSDSFARCLLTALLARTYRLEKDANDYESRVVRCVIPKTPTKRPYIHRFSRSLGCAVGCNGYAAKSSDEIGRLAAVMMMTNEDCDSSRRRRSCWGQNIPQDAFEIVYDDDYY